MIEIVCLHCSQHFLVGNTRKNTAKFCSRLCQNRTNKSRFWLGKKRPKETNEKISKTCKERGIEPRVKFLAYGKDHPNWKGGKFKDERKDIKKLKKYIDWRTSVFERDAYTCQICGQVGKKIQADHIEPWSTHPELRFELSNGRTLCVPCHIKTPTWGRSALKH